MCGRDNPSHLRFCEECGQRLAARVATLGSTAGTVPPTSPLAATASSPVVAPGPPPASQSKARPLAPEVSFARRPAATASSDGRAAAQAGASTVALDPASSGARAMVACMTCGASNEPGLRFCMACGRPLVAADDGGGGHVGAIELMRTLSDTSKSIANDPLPESNAAPIAPARVIDVGQAVSSRPGQRFCPRCRGAYDTGAQFCRFCGLSLAGLTPAYTTNAALPAASSSSAASAASAAGSAAMSSEAREPTTGRPGAPMSVSRGATQAGAPSSRHDHDAGPISVAAAVLAHLVLIRRDGSEGAAHTLGAATDIGRIEGQILFLDDQYVSPRHARIVARGGAFFVRDLESTNGVFMRVPFAASADAGDQEDDRTTIRGHHSEALSEPSSDQPLADQDLFLVGQQVLRFEVVRQAEEAFGAASENGTLLFGTPAAPRYARLTQRTVEGVVRDVFHLRKPDTVIGRESGDIVFTDDPFLSRRHAALRMQPGEGPKRRFTIADLGSSNGTFLRIRDEVRLRHGDHFRIGQQLLRFDIDVSRTGV
jgi:pSer/pThr/pTyr-binding forkhead associated (FHA) protein